MVKPSALRLDQQTTMPGSNTTAPLLAKRRWASTLPSYIPQSHDVQILMPPHEPGELIRSRARGEHRQSLEEEGSKNDEPLHPAVDNRQ